MASSGSRAAADADHAMSDYDSEADSSTHSAAAVAAHRRLRQRYEAASAAAAGAAAASVGHARTQDSSAELYQQESSQSDSEAGMSDASEACNIQLAETGFSDEGSAFEFDSSLINYGTIASSTSVTSPSTCRGRILRT